MNRGVDCVVQFTAYKSCAEIYKSGDKISGVYKIDPDGLGEFEIFCDHKTAGGGWTVGTLRYTTARCYYGYFGRDGLG